MLANEEVTADGRSERGNFPVFRRPLKQWMMRITAYADRLIADLDRLDWPDSIKQMQRNWIGRSTGAIGPLRVTPAGDIEVFTTRPDTLFGATYMVLAPEHPLVDGARRTTAWPEGTPDGVDRRARHPGDGGRRLPQRRPAAAPSSSARPTPKTKTGVFTGSYATNPVNGAEIPVFIADYVLMGYGTGAIMAVPGQDQRDWDFAEAFGLPIVRTVQPPDGLRRPGLRRRRAGHQQRLPRRPRRSRRPRSGSSPGSRNAGAGEGTVTYKLRDWLFSRQRYWGEPFPIVYDEDDLPRAVPESELPVLLPEIEDYAPVTSDDENSMPEPPLGRALDWVEVELDLGDGPEGLPARGEHDAAVGRLVLVRAALPGPDQRGRLRRPARSSSTGWAPQSPDDPGGVDLYVGGVEHAVLHLLYARLWHKVLFDLGHLSSSEPFRRLFNQGYIQAAAFTDERGFHVEASEVVERDGRFFHGDAEVTPRVREDGQEPEELGVARRDVRPLRRRHPAAVRDVHRPARPEPAVGHHRGRRRVPAAAAHLAAR